MGLHYLTTPKSKCFSFIFFSWRLITLQYCSGFCHTLTWINMDLHVFPVLINSMFLTGGHWSQRTKTSFGKKWEMWWDDRIHVENGRVQMSDKGNFFHTAEEWLFLFLFLPWHVSALNYFHTFSIILSFLILKFVK